MIDIRLVESFVLLIRSGSLTRVETLTGISKPTLSRQITKLEALLGVQLVIRSTRRITPTEAGRAFYAQGEHLLAEVATLLETAQTEVQELSNGVSGRLSVLADSQFSTTFVCEVVRLFLLQHPELRCKLDVGGYDKSPSVDEVDCYVCTEPPDLPNLVGKLLGRLSYSLYASPQYLARHGSPATPGDLSGHHAIVLNPSPDRTPVRLHSKDAWFDYRPSDVLATNDHWVNKTFCIDAFGIGLLPDFFARPEVDTGSLCRILPDWHPAPMRVYCAYQKQRYAGRKLRSFIDLMVECIANIDSFNHYVGAKTEAAARKRSQALPGRQGMPDEM